MTTGRDARRAAGAGLHSLAAAGSPSKRAHALQREVNVANNVKNKLVFNQSYYLYPKCTPTQLFQWRNLLQSYQDLLAHGRLRPRETRCHLMRLGKSLSETTSTFPNRLTPATSSAGTSEGRDYIQTSCFLTKQSIHPSSTLFKSFYGFGLRTIIMGSDCAIRQRHDGISAF